LPRVYQIGIWVDGELHHCVLTRARWHLIPAAFLVYASNWHAIESILPELGSAVLRHFGIPLTAIERRRTTQRPRQAIASCPWEPCMYRSDNLAADQIDGLYSELVTLAVEGTD
jgi:hypothetical protein